MIAAFEALREEFRTFGTDGISMVLVCVAILFCIAEKDKLKAGTRKLVSYGVLFFILLANPFGYNIIQSFWMKEYWKIFMVLLPVIFVAIAITELITGQKSVWEGALVAVCCVGIVVSSSFFEIDLSRMDRIKEAYETETEIAALDEMIRAAGIVPENVIAPREVCARIREIDPGIKLLYGEALIEGILDKTVEPTDEEEQQFIDSCTTIVAVPMAVDYQIVVADTYDSNCILLEKAYDEPELMENAGYQCYGRTENYVVYFRR